MTRSITRLALGIIVLLAAAAATRAANDFWDGFVFNPPSGVWGTGLFWLDNTTPGNTDTATFNLAAPYTVTFDAAPAAIQNLTVAEGAVTFASSGGAKTLNINSSAGVQDDLLVTGALFTLGTSGNPLHLTIGDDLLVHGGAVMFVNFGSQVNTPDLLVGTVFTGGDGSVFVDGTGSTLNATTTTILGSNGASGSLTYGNGAQGDLSTAGNVFIGQSSFSTTVGTLNVESDADVNVGNLNIGTHTMGSSMGAVNVQGSGSTLDILGASTLTVGSAAGGTGSLNIGTTTTSGAIVNTSAELFTINARGTVTIGSGATTGTLNANGNVTINGGVLTRSRDSSFNLAAGKTMTIQNGGRATFTGNYTTATNARYDVTGAGSKLEATNMEFDLSLLRINNGAEVNVSFGGSLGFGNFSLIGTSGNGTLLVDGSGSSLVPSPGGTILCIDDFCNAWGSDGNTAMVTFSHGATGMITNNNSGLGLAGSNTAGTTANVDVLSGADLFVDSLFLATNGGSTTAARLNVNGSGSSVTQTGASTLTVGHPATGTAAINIGTTSSGGTFTTGSGTTTINKTGTVTLGFSGPEMILGGVGSGGPVTAVLRANGNVNIDGGLLQVGSFSIAIVAAGKTMTLVNDGTLRGSSSVTGNVVNTSGNVETTSVLTINGNYSQSAAGKLAIDLYLGGDISGHGLRVGGTATLAGTLEVSLSGEIPQLSDEFDILDWGTLAGTFDTLNLPALTPGRIWDTSQLYTLGVLSVVPGLLGDFNQDGTVDGADYVVWRKGLGTIYTQDDFNIWRAHFGETAGSGALADDAPPRLAVPEPTSLVLSALASVAFYSRRRKNTLVGR